MKNQKMIFKRVAATLGIVLMMIPLMALGVAANTVESTETPYTKLCNALGKKVQSADMAFLKNCYSDPSTLGMVFYRDYDEYENLDYVVITQKYLRDFKSGYTSNVGMGVASWKISFRWWGTIDEEYGGEWQLEEFSSRGTVYYNIEYGGSCSVCLWAHDTNDGGLRRVQLFYDCIESGLKWDGITNYSVYSLSNVEIEFDDLTTKYMNDDYNSDMEPYLSELIFAFEGLYSIVPDYTFSNLLGVTGEDAEQYYSAWYSPMSILHYYNGIYGSGYEYGSDYGWESGYDMGYQDGSDYGWEFGYDMGFQDGAEQGRNEGYEVGAEYGYNKGFGDGETSALNAKNTFGDMVIGIFEAPVKLIDGMLNFDIFGINIAGFVKVLLTLAVTAAIVFFVIKVTKG